MKNSLRDGVLPIPYPLPVLEIDHFKSREEWEKRWYRPGNLASDFESLLHCGFANAIVSDPDPLHPNNAISQIVHYFGVACEPLRIEQGAEGQPTGRPISREEYEVRIGLAKKAYQMLITQFFKMMPRRAAPFEDGGEELWWMLFFFNTDKVVNAMRALFPVSKKQLLPHFGVFDNGCEWAATRDAMCSMVSTMYYLEDEWSSRIPRARSKDAVYLSGNIKRIRELKPWMAKILSSLGCLGVLKRHLDDQDTRTALWSLVREEYPGKARQKALAEAAGEGNKAAEMLLLYDAVHVGD